MQLLRALSETAIGNALLAYAIDLPRWTIINIVFAISLLPAYLALSNGVLLGIGVATLPTALVLVCMINMAASHTEEKAPRLRDILAYPSTLFAVFIVWLAMVIALTLILSGIPTIVIFIIGIVMLSLMMIGVFAIYMPSQLKVNGLLIWRNALVLAVSYPMIGLGLLALSIVGIWAIWISKGALIVVIPSLWVVLAAFTVDDRIKTMQAAHGN